nr:MFS transporter [uncultured Capnocytophaga sp.]
MSESKQSFLQTIKSYNPTFWVANFLQIMERGAWFGVFSLLGLYLVASTDEGGLGLSHIEKGNILANVTAIQFFLPLFFGVIADRIGYKLSLIIAFVIIGVGYYLMGTVNSYWAVYLAFLFAAIGGSFFKPVASGIIARTTDEKTSTMGFGLFYLMANIGGFFGPAFSSYLRTTMGWRIIFLQGAAMILVNLLVVLFFYKEKKISREYNVPILDEIKGSFQHIIEALKDTKLSVLLILMVGYWLVYNQLFYTLPNFIEDWVDSSLQSDWINRHIPFLGTTLTENGQIKAEWYGNLDSVMIIFLQVSISYMVMQMKQVSALIRGTIIATLGVVLTFVFNNVWFTIIGTVIFAVGEMIAGPTLYAYVAQITPKGKEALYQGTLFLPVAAANYLTGFVTGDLYQKWSDKYSLLQRELAQRQITLPEGLSKKQFFEQAQEKLQMSHSQITEFLWNTYQPNKLWYIVLTMGAFTAISVFIYNKIVVKKQ